MAAAFARAATGLLLDGDTITSAGELDAGLSTALVDRARIHQAQGMVMVDLRVSLVEALTRMRARAFSSDTTLLEVADQVIAGTLTADTLDRRRRQSPRVSDMTILGTEEGA